MRKDVLKPFQDKQDFMEERVKYGIESGRKGFGRLHLTDSDNRPAAGAKITLRQLNHEFRCGANLFMLDEFSQPEQNQQYKQYFADVFNIATLPFYWSDLEPEEGKPRYAKDSPKVYRRPAPDLCLEFCAEHGIEPKAHCLSYANWTPKWVKSDVASEKRLLAAHFKELAERYARLIPSWEVTNENFWGEKDYWPNDVPFYFEPDYVEWGFNTARAFFPGNRLLINEAHRRVWCDDWYFRDRSPYYMLIERAMLKGAKIDGVGMQYHMFFPADKEASGTKIYYDPARIYAVLDTYAQLGVPLQITETTIPAYSNDPADEEIQAEIVRNLYSMWFSHPAMEAVFYWNLIDGFAYGHPGDMTYGENYYYGGLIRYDFTPKPAYRVIKDLFQKTWRTPEMTIESRADGECEFRGFYGEYAAEIVYNGKMEKRIIKLSKNTKARFDLKLS